MIANSTTAARLALALAASLVAVAALASPAAAQARLLGIHSTGLAPARLVSIDRTTFYVTPLATVLAQVDALAQSPTGELFAADNFTGRIVVLNVSTGAIIRVVAQTASLGTVLAMDVEPMTGQPGALAAWGSADVAVNDLLLRATGLPAQTTAFFLNGRAPTMIAIPGVGQGYLCLAGAIGRYLQPGQVQLTDGGGSVSLALDLSATPTPLGFVAIAPGETWHFQCWYRDRNPTATNNLTHAVAVSFR